MKTAVILLLSFAACSFAADPKPNPVKEPDGRAKTGEVKRLGSVTWDLDTHKLVWVVQRGVMVNGEFVPASEQRYEISPDRAAMIVAEEERGFDGDEAVSLHHLLDVLSLYCAESVAWWDEGQGSPVNSRPAPRTEKPKTGQEDKPVKVTQPEEKSKPKYRVPDSHMVARVNW